jgi:hypothetical protein
MLFSGRRAASAALRSPLDRPLSPRARYGVLLSGAALVSLALVAVTGGFRDPHFGALHHRLHGFGALVDSAALLGPLRQAGIYLSSHGTRASYWHTPPQVLVDEPGHALVTFVCEIPAGCVFVCVCGLRRHGSEVLCGCGSGC